jgi:anti-anti-sigma factor
MDAKVENSNGVYVINLSGQMNFETADQLKTQCLKNFSSHDIILNLKELNFVGSSGITPFLELIDELAKSLGNRFKICSVGVDFMRLFQSSDADGIEIYKDVNDARLAFVNGAEALAITRLKPFGLKVSIE